MKNNGKRFDNSGFKAGDIVKVLDAGTTDLTVGNTYTLQNYGSVPCIPGGRSAQWNGFDMQVEKIEEVQYEDDWVLVKGGVIVPDDADVSLSQAGHVVAFRPVKKPKVVETVRYASQDGKGGTSSWNDGTYTVPVVFVTTDGILTDVYLKK